MDGIFLSEQPDVPQKDERRSAGPEDGCRFSMEEKWMLLSQLYVGKLQASITEELPYRMMRQTLNGEVSG